MKYFHSIYYHLYSNSKVNNATPEIPVILFISFCQTNNLLLLFNIFLIVFSINYEYKIHHFYIIIQIVLYILNYYYYQIKKIGKSVIINKKYSLGKKKLFIYVYIVLSVFFTGFTYYLLEKSINA